MSASTGTLDSERLLHHVVSRYCLLRNQQAKKIDVLKEIRVDVEKSSVFDEDIFDQLGDISRDLLVSCDDIAIGLDVNTKKLLDSFDNLDRLKDVLLDESDCLFAEATACEKLDELKRRFSDTSEKISSMKSFDSTVAQIAEGKKRSTQVEMSSKEQQNMNLTMEIIVKTIDKLSSKIRLLNQHFTQLKIINGNQVAVQQKKTNTSLSGLFGVYQHQQQIPNFVSLNSETTLASKKLKEIKLRLNKMATSQTSFVGPALRQSSIATQAESEEKPKIPKKRTPKLEKIKARDMTSAITKSTQTNIKVEADVPKSSPAVAFTTKSTQTNIKVELDVAKPSPVVPVTVKSTQTDIKVEEDVSKSSPVAIGTVNTFADGSTAINNALGGGSVFGGSAFGGGVTSASATNAFVGGVSTAKDNSSGSTSTFGGGALISKDNSSGSTSAFGGGASAVTNNVFGGGASIGPTSTLGGGSGFSGSAFGGGGGSTNTSSVFGGGGLTSTDNSFGSTSAFGGGLSAGTTNAFGGGSTFGGSAFGGSAFGGGGGSTTVASAFGGGGSITAASTFGGGSSIGTTSAFGGARSNETSTAFGGGSAFGGASMRSGSGFSGSAFGGGFGSPATASSGFGSTAFGSPSGFGGSPFSTPKAGGSMFGGGTTSSSNQGGGSGFSRFANMASGFGQMAVSPSSQQQSGGSAAFTSYRK